MAESWTEVRNTQDDPGTSCSTTKVLKKKKNERYIKGHKEPTEKSPNVRSWRKVPSGPNKKINKSVSRPRYKVNTYDTILI